jgi:hypothetical protein
MTTLSNLDLANVTGGKGTSTSSSNDQVLSTLQNIQGSIKDLSKNQNNGLFGGQNGLLFMTMALALGRRNDVVVSGCGGRGKITWRW